MLRLASQQLFRSTSTVVLRPHYANANVNAALTTQKQFFSATAQAAAATSQKLSEGARSGFETTMGMTHAPFLPKSAPCPYLAGKQLLGGFAHIALSVAPIIEAPIKLVHAPLSMVGPSFLCPHLLVKSQLQNLAGATADANIMEKK
ncbi:unnamed protein product [Amoebophrya sp. A120]|nr:unnamed protein product [Amoebophrya sp. A120]|eukprot:GSA120T00023967001.1